MAFKIFIGWDSRFAEVADVLAHSIVENSSISLEINFLKLHELQLNRAHDPLASTEFTYSRFLVPHLCGYRGTALFLDNDMVCFGDIAEIASLDMNHHALRVVKHDYAPKSATKMDGAVQTSYPRKNWSSMMLMRCDLLELWSKEAVEKASGSTLHRFAGIADELIGEIPPGWNDLDHMTERTKLLHYTSGGPWFDQCKNHPHAEEWLRARDDWVKAKRPDHRGLNKVLAS